ncbi:ferritin-like domain-containing protein [Streptomyces sp. NPDC005900]|uniref:ferritin-like domain-containing protein n=1 Tax=Streptomyces sp. NPDC005900 TaxID=3154569 RepID=UPI0033E16D3E
MTTSKRGSWELPISESELARLTKEMDQAHQETLPVMAASARDLTQEIHDLRAAEPDTGPRQRVHVARRRFLIGAGASAAALALAACGGDSDGSTGTPSKSPSGSGGTYTGDLKVVALAAALENQAVGAYQAALKAAKDGKLGKVPPVFATFAQTAMDQHKDHADAWNAILASADKPKITGTPLSNHDDVTKALGKVKDVPGVAKLALRLEDQATQTYVFAASNVKSKGGIETAATIAPVEAMHSAILHYVLGQYPVPDDFIGTDKAASPSLLTV